LSAVPILEENRSATSLHIDAGPADIAELKRLTRGGARALNEQFDDDSHLNEIIPKPWGYEYRAYVDDFFDLWSLHIDVSHSTSTHAHPRKLTYLLCLSGEGVTAGLEREFPVKPGSIVRIAPGAFHSTRNTGSEALELIEVEVPRNKYDLMRLRDDYNRAGKSYESTSLVEEKFPLKPTRRLPNAKVRSGSPDGKFHFEIRTGMDVFYRRHPEDIFYIPLCVSGVVYSDIRILANSSENSRPEPDKNYLCVSRAN